MWNISLTKEDKRLCRELMHLGLERECKKFVLDIQELSTKVIPLEEQNAPYQEVEGRSVEGPWHKRYIALFRKTQSYDKHVARRYDGISGGRYLDCVLDLYCSDWISDEEIEPFSEEPRSFLQRYKNDLKG